VNNYEKYIHLSRYARWNDILGRRERWPETVARYCDFFKGRFGDTFPYDLVRKHIESLSVVPSMRCLMTAGKALDIDEVAGYNCSYVAIDHPRAFDEIMYILMCGTGVGFSVEEKYVEQLPAIEGDFHTTDTTITVPDSRVGWASSFRELISLLYSGRIPKWDLSRIRPAGARLKTFGGRASGPEPLASLFSWTTDLFRKAAGRRLSTLEAHDLVCKIADVVIVGGVRRSALISLSDLRDRPLAKAKMGSWWTENPQRALANNSAVYSSKPEFESFLREWQLLYESKSGERGIFNRVAATKQAASSGRRDTEGWEFGTNPCGEIILRSMGFCNLSEVIVRPDDTFESLKEKVEVATIIGTFQSTLTNFRYLRKGWKKNAEEERLLGVSFTGIFDNIQMCGEWQEAHLENLKQHAINVNREWADKLGIPCSAAITCVKPSGTVSQLAGCSSGIHPAYAPYYLRSVRSDNKDPITQFLKDSGVPFEPEKGHPDTISVFYFPVKAPEGSVTRNEISAMEHLRIYDIYRKYWCEHNPSITVYYGDDEFLDVGSWVYRNFDSVGGIAFLPRSDHVYAQAPYQEITEEDYLQRSSTFPVVDWEKFYEYEKEDQTVNQHDLACSAGLCEL
jgi:ribonucleoside-triphosphate reductase